MHFVGLFMLALHYFLSDFFMVVFFVIYFRDWRRGLFKEHKRKINRLVAAPIARGSFGVAIATAESANRRRHSAINHPSGPAHRQT